MKQELKLSKMEEIRAAFKQQVLGINSIALAAVAAGSGAYGGTLRKEMGALAPQVCAVIVYLAAEEAGLDMKHLKIVPKHFTTVYLTDANYLDVVNNDTAEYVVENIGSMYTKVESDIAIFYYDTFIHSIECKKYADKTMTHRLALDCSMLARVYPTVTYSLFQFESGLMGDYHRDLEFYEGSPALHTALSCVTPKVNIDVFTLLDHKRVAGKSITNKGCFKPISMFKLNRTVEGYKDILLRQVDRKHLVLGCR